MYDPLRYNRNTLFNDDLLYHYMLESDLPEIKALCMTDRNAAKLCNSPSFWTKKMMYDNLPIYKPDNNMIEYQRVLKAVNRVNQIDILDLNHNRLNMKLTNEDLSLVIDLDHYDPTFVETQYITLSIADETLFVEIFIVLLPSTARRRGLSSSFYLTYNKEDTYSILRDLFYYYPNIVITPNRFI